MDKLIKIRDVSIQYGISTRTLKYYEDMGLLKSTKCSEYSYRMYDVEAIKRLEQILILRKLNISIKDIALIFETNNTDVVLSVLSQKVNDIDEEAALLNELKDIINNFIKQIKGMDFSKDSDVKLLYEKTKDIELEINNLDYQGNTSQVNKLFEVTEKLEKINEEKTANKSLYAIREFQGGKYIDGIPALKWGQLNDCTYAGAVKLLLDVAGMNISYEEIMGFSGCCYHFAMKKNWCPSTCMPQIAFNPTAYLDKAIGLENNGFHPEHMNQQVKEKINNGIPIMCIQPRVEMEWGVICGYIEDNKFFGRSYFDYLKPADIDIFTDNHYYYADCFPGIAPELNMCYYKKKTAPFPLIESLKTSLELAQDLFYRENTRDTYFGTEAYDIIINGLRLNDKDFASITPYGSTGNGIIALSHLIDAKRSAYEFWKIKHIYLTSDNNKKMQLVSELYKNMTDELLKILPYNIIASSYNGYPQENWSSEKRHEIADALTKVIAFENEVHSIITDVLNNW